MSEGVDVTLECTVNKPDQKATWLVNGTEIVPDNKHVIVVDGSTHRLILPGVCPDQSAEYTCTIGDVSTSAKLDIEGRI